MLKKLSLLVVFVLCVSFNVAEEVYICNSKNAKKYHLTENCQGLRNCKSETIKITLAKAKDQGKTLCGFED